MALKDFYETFLLVEQTTQSDGMGGFETVYLEKEQFQGGISLNNSNEMLIAEQQGLKNNYILIINLDTEIKYQDIIKRVKDNCYFRIKSNPTDMETPKKSRVKFKQMNLEKIDIPSE